MANLAEDAEEILPEDLPYLSVCIAVLEEGERERGKLRYVLQSAGRGVHSVKVRSQGHVVHADEADNVIDVLYDCLDVSVVVVREK